MLTTINVVLHSIERTEYSAIQIILKRIK